MDHTRGLTCRLTFGWVWAMRITSRRSEGGRKIKSRYLFSCAPVEKNLSVAKSTSSLAGAELLYKHLVGDATVIALVTPLFQPSFGSFRLRRLTVS